MSRPRLIELIFGIATAVAQVIVVVILFVSGFSAEDWFDWIFSSVLLLLPALIVFVGSYAHVIDGKGYGRIILGFGALVMGALGLAELWFGGVVYVHGVVLATLIILPDVTAVISFLASLFVDTDR
jgi:hypothetical protein